MDVNEEYFEAVLRDLGVSKQKIEQIKQKFEGFRVYFRKRTLLREQIRKEYKKLIVYLPKNKVIEILSKMFEQSKKFVRESIECE